MRNGQTSKQFVYGIFTLKKCYLTYFDMENDYKYNVKRYRDNVKKLSKAFRDRPSSPLETAVWWIEYVGRGNGLAYIRSDAAEQPWWPSFRLLREVQQPFYSVAEEATITRSLVARDSRLLQTFSTVCVCNGVGYEG
ncbi:hypothetical protein M0802_004326 [Mischocyttarus mexicanus]|nr:hypothetical protein M0802_004326 [Mischocyttarus mexicanus]